MTHAVVRATTRIAVRNDLVRLGSDYGGWWIPAQLITADSVIYSAGVGEDVSFDLALIQRFGCEVWAVDPTPRSIEFARHICEPRFHFFPIGLWFEDTELKFYAPSDPAHVSHSALNIQGTESFFTAPCRSLPLLMQQLGHNRIDVLKMDIEGAEGPVLDAMLYEGVRPRILCVEFDAVEPPWRLHVRLRKLIRVGYAVCRIEKRNYTLIWEEAWDGVQ